MSISYTNPIQPDDIPELLTSLSKDRAILKKRRAEKYAAIGISVPLFTASLLCAMFGYVYLFFEERFWGNSPPWGNLPIFCAIICF